MYETYIGTYNVLIHGIRQYNNSFYFRKRQKKRKAKLLWLNPQNEG